jgi:hypothetical protein
MRGCYDRLPGDPYMPKDTSFLRCRRLSAVHGPLSALHTAPTSVTQPAKVNWMFGDVKRTFAALEDEMVHSQSFLDAVSTFRQVAAIDDSEVIDAHAIRTLAHPGGRGEPAPEGIHRDGRRVLGIFCFGRTNISGAVTELYRSASEPPVWSGELQPGNGVLVNDREGAALHYTTSIESLDGRRPGTRDVLVLVV